MKNMTLAQAYKQQFGNVSYPFKIYDANGKQTYYETSHGFWWRYEYDANGHRTYLEDSNGFWDKRKYDSSGKLTYYENSEGRIQGQKQTIEIDGVEYSAEQVRERIAELKPIQDN